MISQMIRMIRTSAFSGRTEFSVTTTEADSSWIRTGYLSRQELYRWDVFADWDPSDNLYSFQGTDALREHMSEFTPIEFSVMTDGAALS